MTCRRRCGTFDLSPREQQLVQAWALGLSNREWAAAAGVSYETARVYARRVRAKRGPKTKAVADAIRRGEVA